MKTKDFDYDLPPELIAQTPLEKRDGSRLLTLDKTTGAIGHHHFYDLPQFLRPGDCLVLNNSRVLPARLIGHRDTGGTAEVLLLTDRGDNLWECLVRPGKKLRAGARVHFGDGQLEAEIQEVLPDGNRLVKFFYEGIFLEVLEQLGRMPLPPYIKEELQDGERYQTVYSKVVGSAAAPTAGLHFTPELLENVQAMGVKLAYVTLHVGLGTFRPVKVDDVEAHDMHAEFCAIPQETADSGEPDQSQWGTDYLRGHHLLPHHRVLRQPGRDAASKVRVDEYLHLPRLPVQVPGRPHHQLPPARIHPHHAGLRSGRTGTCAGRLR